MSNNFFDGLISGRQYRPHLLTLNQIIEVFLMLVSNIKTIKIV